MNKPKGKVKTLWSSDFAYAIGLITTDGNLSSDGRHISFCSKDRELIQHYQNALQIKVTVGKKSRYLEKEKKYFVVQFGDVLFYRFLQSIGLMPNKSKILKTVKIPREYFFDFLRGCFDGDGTFYSYWDPRWKSSFMFYTVFCSASRPFIDWLRFEIAKLAGIKGHVASGGRQGSSMSYLKYAKSESLILIQKLYPNSSVRCLRRKHLKIIKALSILVEH